MSKDYTPTLGHVRTVYISHKIDCRDAPKTESMVQAEFDRAIAKIKADAWQEGWDAGAGWPQDDTNPHKDAS